MLIVKKTNAVRVDQREVENKNGEATVYLYGDIGGWFGIDHLEFVKEFNAIDAGTIHLRVDSNGGDVFEARTIKTAIMQHKAKVIGHVDGIAASAASFLLMGCDEVEIVDGGFIMIHRAMSFVDIFGYFNADDLDDLINDMGKERALHEKINESIANDYVKGTENSKEKVLEWMAAETWFTAKEAVDNSFADRIYDGKPVEGKYDLSIFNNVPEELKLRDQSIQTNEETQKEDLTVRDAEKALRDVGFSRNRSKEIIAKGFQDECDAQSDAVNQNEREVQNDDSNSQRDAENGETEQKLEEDQVVKDKTYDLIGRANKLTNFKQGA